MTVMKTHHVVPVNAKVGIANARGRRVDRSRRSWNFPLSPLQKLVLLLHSSPLESYGIADSEPEKAVTMTSTTDTTHATHDSSPSSGKKQSPEEAAAEQDLNKLLRNNNSHHNLTHSSAPKGLGQGLSQGISNIVGGAVGAAGIAVLGPTMGLAVGAKQAGVLGGVAGLVGGTVIGLVGGAGMLLGGAVSGATQIVRGVLAAPEAAMAPSQGKWWNDVEGTNVIVYCALLVCTESTVYCIYLLFYQVFSHLVFHYCLFRSLGTDQTIK
jgi:hypothetical protein